jgi:hypothetical protein
MSLLFSIRWWTFPLTLGALLLTPLPAAQDGKKRVKVTIVTILATTRAEPVDRRLKCIAAEVRKKDPDLKGFKLLTMECKSLAINQKYQFKLVEGQEAKVVIHRGADKNNWVELKVKAPLQGCIVYECVCGKFLPIITRYKTKKKDERLIIAIMVKPCHKK